MGAVQDSVTCRLDRRFIEVIAPGIQISLIVGKVAAGEFNTQPMAGQHVGRRYQTAERHRIDLTGVHELRVRIAVAVAQSRRRVAQVVRSSRGVHIDELEHEIRIRCR